MSQDFNANAWNEIYTKEMSFMIAIRRWEVAFWLWPKRTLKLIFNDPTTRKSDFFQQQAQQSQNDCNFFSRAFVQQFFWPPTRQWPKNSMKYDIANNKKVNLRDRLKSKLDEEKKM